MNSWNSFVDRFISISGTDASHLYTLLKAVSVLAAAIAGWLVLKRLLNIFEKRLHQYEVIQNNPQSLSIVRKALFYLMILLVGTTMIRFLNILMIEKAFYAVFIILLASPAKDVLVMVLTYFENNIAHKTDTQVDNIIFELSNRFAGVVIYATAFVLALDMLNVNVMPFIAGAGVAGIAIGFAAKDTLSNLIAGVLLIMDRPFEIGDRIEVWNAPKGTATWGDVIDIGLRATKIRTTDNLVIVIPNNEIMKRDIVNYTLISSDIRVRVDIGVSYDADIVKAKELILEVAGSAEWILKQPPPKVVVRSFDESSVGLQLRVWIHDARKRMDTISFVTDKVKESFDKGGIEIPYPKRDITVRYHDGSDRSPAKKG